MRTFIKWTVSFLGAALLLMLAATIGGVFLPAEHQVSRSIVLQHPPVEVWAIFADHAADPTWRSNVKKIEALPNRNGHPLWRETYQSGDSLTFEDAEVTPQQRLVRVIANEGGPFSGSWTIELAAQGSGSRVTVTERGRVPNPFFRFVNRYLIGQTTEIERYLKSLGNKFGEQVEPE